MSEDRLELEACAKLNLFLHVTGRREDGYHLLQTLFQFVDLCDRVVLERAPAGEIGFLPGSDAPGGDEDLTLRAARLLAARAPGQVGVRIGLRKRIPAGGGLGGGSSDAATVLLGLHRLWGLDLGMDALAELGETLGADVPVFVRGRTAWGEGVGERLTPIGTDAAHFVICDPGVHVDTVRIFADPELTRDTPVKRIPAFFEGVGRNDCEVVARRLYPAVDAALAWLGRHGDARLTGTGGCCFLACRDAATARRIAADCPAPFSAWAVRALEQSPTVRALGA
ncbi:MAG: 4-(cytidine 5'-diphospho)-2-C-methyl-D-erythritol kinase [Pseudomonadales bacterium]|nr:4-(cytidine 5'-diphospho)-2-C-methyl-D-erythritol kinase [Pseudomonadales bacterium]